MSESNDHDDVFKPLPSIRNLPFVNLRFAHPRYIALAVVVWIAAFLLIQVLGGPSGSLAQSPYQLLAEGAVCLAFGACCLVILYKATFEEAVLARPEERLPFRKDLRRIAFVLVFLGALACVQAARSFLNR